MTKIIAMTNQKGGVGKTTSSINLAACLAVAEKRTLLVDLDPQGNASTGVGIDSNDCVNANIYHALIGIKPIKETIYNTELPNFDICPSNNDLVGAEIELVGEIARERKLKDAFSSIEGEYDYIIIDCPPSLGLLTLNALNASTEYIIPLQTEFYAMEGMAQLLNTVRLVKNSLNQKLELSGILLTLFDSRVGLHRQVVHDIRSHFKEKVFDTVIPKNVKLAESPSFGKPIILYDIKSKGSDAYISLVREILIRDRNKENNLNTITENRI